MKRTCGTCSLWDRDKARDSAGRIRANRVAPCLWVADIKLPASVAFTAIHLKPKYMARDYGLDCPCWLRYSPDPRRAE